MRAREYEIEDNSSCLSSLDFYLQSCESLEQYLAKESSCESGIIFNFIFWSEIINSKIIIDFKKILFSMKIITISGLDGSGKTTQADLLEKHWQQTGRRVLCFHSAQFSIANRLLIKKEKRGSGQSPAVSRASWPKIFLRKIALLIDILHFRIRLSLWRRRFDFLLADRYFFDQLLNIAFLENKRNLEEFSPLEEILTRLIPRPSYCFFIELNPQEILKRSRGVEQGLEYLKKKAPLYQSLTQHPFFIKIDGSQDKQAIFEKILDKIK